MSGMLTVSETIEILQQITYKPGWSIMVSPPAEDRMYVVLQVEEFAAAALDSARRDGTRTPWRSGKRYLSPHMCRQEVVGAVFALIKDAEMHECHEWFRYRGASIYNPHLDPDVLVDVARKASSYCVRENAMSMAEGGGG